MFSARGEREKVAMKVNNTAEIPQRASAKCSMNTTLTMVDPTGCGSST